MNQQFLLLGAVNSSRSGRVGGQKLLVGGGGGDTGRFNISRSGGRGQQFSVQWGEVNCSWLGGGRRSSVLGLGKGGGVDQ